MANVVCINTLNRRVCFKIKDMSSLTKETESKFTKIAFRNGDIITVELDFDVLVKHMSEGV